MKPRNLLSIIFISLSVACSAGAAIHQNYVNLFNTDGESLQKTVLSGLKGWSSRDEYQKTAALVDSLRILLARPDEDGFRTHVFLAVRAKNSNQQRLANSLQQLSDEALLGIQNKKLTKVDRCTYVIILQNLIALLRPELPTSPLWQRLMKKIADRKLQLDPALAQDRISRGLRPLTSPSDMAASALKNLNL